MMVKKTIFSLFIFLLLASLSIISVIAESESDIELHIERNGLCRLDTLIVNHRTERINTSCNTSILDFRTDKLLFCIYEHGSLGPNMQLVSGGWVAMPPYLMLKRVKITLCAAEKTLVRTGISIFGILILF